MPLAPATRLGNYEIVGDLGACGMGEVYRTRDCLKALHPELGSPPPPEQSWHTLEGVMRILTLVIVLIAAPAIVSAQTPLLTGGRSALMIQIGADMPSFEHKAGETQLLRFDGNQPWAAVTGVFPRGSRTSFLFGVSMASASARVENPGRFAVSPGTAHYLGWNQRGYTLQIQAGTIIWFK